MSDNDLGSMNFGGVKLEKITVDSHLSKHQLRIDGPNKDITEIYYWIYNYFSYYSGKGYITLKLEDHHYFSENSQFGANYRQMKGNTIRVFQENFQQLIQTVKVHMIPLLKEVKQADFYRKWIEQITYNDEKVQDELSKSKPNAADLKKYRMERNEAISHLKDKWVMEVDGGKMWQMNRSATEQGLDFALLPQLFFGTSLDDPLQRNKTLKEQLDETIYGVDISQDAKEQVARFMYKFYTWLPSVIRETQTTFKIKIATLKQLYGNVQMTMNFIKPLLVEINRKKESFDFNNEYKDFEMEHPDLVNLLDYSYSFIRNVGIRNFLHKDRDNFKIKDLEFSPFGLFIEKEYHIPNGGNPPISKGIFSGPFEGKSGFLNGQEGDKYVFYPCEKKNITYKEFKKLDRVLIDIDDFQKFPVIEMTFLQRRRGEMIQTQQGPQQVPMMKNEVIMMSKCWNIYEIAYYRRELKEKDFELLEGFIEEIKVVKEELLYYANDMQTGYDPYDFGSGKSSANGNSSSNNKNKSKGDAKMLVLGPFQGIYDMFSPLLSPFKFGGGGDKSSKKHSWGPNRDIGKHPKGEAHMIAKLDSMEDVWKIYRVYKLGHGLMMY